MALAICQANHILLLILNSQLLLERAERSHKTVKSHLIARISQDKPIKYQCSTKPVNSSRYFPLDAVDPKVWAGRKLFS